MSVDHVLDQLVQLGAIGPDQADAARRVDLSVAASAAGRLEACGLDADAMLAAVSQVCGIAVAPAQLLTRARRVVLKGGDQEVLRRLLAWPAGADKSGRLQILIADPESAAHLPHLGLPDYRAWLAPERFLRELIGAPGTPADAGPEIVSGVDDQLRMMRALSHGAADLSTGLELGGAPASDQDTYTTQSDLRRPSTEALEAPRVPAPVLPRAPSPPPWSPTPATRGGAGAAPPRTEAPLVRAPTPVALPRTPPPLPPRPPPPAAPPNPYQAAVGELPPAITFLPPMREPQAEAAAAPQPAPHSATHPATPAAAAPTRPAPAAGAPARKGAPRALLAGSVVVALLAAVAVAILWGRRPTPATVDPADDKQRALLADARARAAAGDHAWAFSSCTDAIKAKPGTSLAHDAELLCAKERLALGERQDAANDLRKLIGALPPGDARRAQAEELLTGIVGPSP